MAGPQIVPAGPDLVIPTIDPSADQPATFVIDETVACANIEITLFSIVVVDRFARVSGLIKVGGRQDIRLSSVPDLAIETKVARS